MNMLHKVKHNLKKDQKVKHKDVSYSFRTTDAQQQVEERCEFPSSTDQNQKWWVRFFGTYELISKHEVFSDIEFTADYGFKHRKTVVHHKNLHYR